MTCQQYTVDVAPSSTVDALTFSPDDFSAKKMIVTMRAKSGNTQSAYELCLAWSGSFPAITADHVVYAGVGDAMDIVFDASFNGEDIVVSVTNNETYDIIFDFAEMGTVS